MHIFVSKLRISTHSSLQPLTQQLQADKNKHKSGCCLFTIIIHDDDDDDIIEEADRFVLISFIYLTPWFIYFSFLQSANKCRFSYHLFSSFHLNDDSISFTIGKQITNSRPSFSYDHFISFKWSVDFVYNSQTQTNTTQPPSLSQHFIPLKWSVDFVYNTQTNNSHPPIVFILFSSRPSFISHHFISFHLNQTICFTIRKQIPHSRHSPSYHFFLSHHIIFNKKLVVLFYNTHTNTT